MSIVKKRFFFFKNIDIVTPTQYQALRNAYDMALSQKNKVVRVEGVTIPVKKVAAYFNQHPNPPSLEKPSEKTTPVKSTPTKPTPESQSSQTTTPQSHLQVAIDQHKTQQVMIAAKHQAANLAAARAATAMGVPNHPHLNGLAFNILSNNPNLSPYRLAEVLISLTHQTSTRPTVSPEVIRQQSNNLNRQNTLPDKESALIEAAAQENREAIKKALGSGVRVGPAITTKPDDITHQITQAVSPHFAESSSGRNPIAERSARQIMKAAERLSTAANPINLSDKDIKEGIKESLRTLGNNRAVKVVDAIDSKLLRLTLDQASQTTIAHLQPEYSPTSGLTPLARANLRTITTLSYRQSEAPHLVAGKLISQHYQQSPTYIPTPIQRFWQMIFPKQSYIQYNYNTLAPQITEYQSAAPSPPLNLIQIIKNPGGFFSGLGGGGGMGGGGSLGGGLKNLLSNGLTGLKNAFKLGRGASTGAKALQSGVKMDGLASKFLSGLALRNPAFWYYVFLPLLIFGITLLAFQFLHMKRTTAEVRPDYGQNAGGGDLSESQSKYARVIKTASTSKLEDPVGSIKYTYEITPLLGPITITDFSDTTTIYQESGEKTLSLNTQPEPPPSELTSNYTSSPFTLTLDSSMDDAIVKNVVEITFVNPEGITETISGPAITIIGNPPTGCYVLAEPPAPEPSVGAVSWSTSPDSSAKELNAAAAIIGVFGGENPVLCSGPINLYLARSGLSVDYGGWFLGDGNIAIDFKKGTVGSQTNALYTLAHESGHVYDERSGLSLTSFRQAGLVSWTGSTCQNNIYPNPAFILSVPNRAETRCYTENFAEGFALFITGRSLPSGWYEWYQSNVFK